MKKLMALLIVAVFFSLVFFLFYKEGTLPVDQYDQSYKIFVVKKGEGLTEIAKNLSQNDLIRNRLVFYLVVKKERYDKNLEAGDFRLSRSMSVYEIAKALTHGTLDVWVTIIEGMRREEVAQLMSQNLFIPESEFIKQSQEGYLFPDTSLIPRQATAGGIIDILTANFDKKYNGDLQSVARQRGLTENEIVTLASFVEREAHFDSDRQKVASIILKRYRAGWPLQIDASLQYALGYQPDTKTWWKKSLTSADLAIDSPYNTYKNTGLPPTPICNPGLASIKAVLQADPQTPYWFYVSDSQGHLHFAKTNEEQDANIQKYVR